MHSLKRRRKEVLIGTAGWTIPRAHSAAFTEEGSHLFRYAAVLPCAEINSSFYRQHSFETYKRWATQTPPAFKFSVKLPSVITHEQHLRRARRPLQEFLSEVKGLGRKLGPLLLQLPPSLEFNSRTARAFFTLLREEFKGAVVCEPRHPSWFGAKPEEILIHYCVRRVATDPTRIDDARRPGGAMGRGSIAYYRLHGSPRKYWSSYERSRLEAWSREIAALTSSVTVWCIFDNTASGAALGNALELREMLKEKIGPTVGRKSEYPHRDVR